VTLTVFVTGASAGFGAAIARRFVRDGHRVILAARRADRLAALAAELGDKALAFPLDVTDAAAVAALPGSLPEAWREVDVLVNNAGLALGLGPSFEASIAQWDTMVATNVTGVLHITRALLPGMVARNRGLPGRARVRRLQSLRHPVQPEPARRPDRHGRARDRP
jgi:3-hydroxy acid dehydrogenase/malonic semialdehyde reductase